MLARKKLDHRILDIDDPETLALFCALFDALNGQRLSNSKPWQKDNLVNDSNALLQVELGKVNFILGLGLDFDRPCLTRTTWYLVNERKCAAAGRVNYRVNYTLAWAWA